MGAFEDAERQFHEEVEAIVSAGFPPLHALASPRLPHRFVGQLTFAPDGHATGIDLIYKGPGAEVRVETLIDDDADDGPDDPAELAREELEDTLTDIGADPATAWEAPLRSLRLDVGGTELDFVAVGDDAAWCAVAQQRLPDGRALDILVRATGVAVDDCSLERLASLDGYRY